MAHGCRNCTRLPKLDWSCRGDCFSGTAVQSEMSPQMVAKISQERIHRRLRGKWSGTVTPELGGYGQQYNFVDNDTVRDNDGTRLSTLTNPPGQIEVTILTNTITAKYQINTSKEPYTMDIIIIPPGQTQPQVFSFKIAAPHPAPNHLSLGRSVHLPI